LLGIGLVTAGAISCGGLVLDAVIDRSASRWSRSRSSA
jgi:hypothetical protein